MRVRMMVVCLTLLMCMGRANADNTITIGDVTAAAGSRVSIPISFNSERLLSGFQFHVALPEGVTLVDNVLADRCLTTNAYGVESPLIAISSNFNEGVYKYAAIPVGADPITDYEGIVFYMDVNIDKSVAPNDYEVKITKAMFVEETGGEPAVADAVATLTVNPVVEVSDFSFYADKLVIAEGQTTATLYIALTNSEPVKRFALNVILPEGVSVKYDDKYGFYYYDNTERFDNGEEGAKVYPSCGMKNHFFYISGEPASAVPVGDGCIISLPLTVTTAAPGTYDVVLTNQIITKEDESSIVHLFHETPYLVEDETPNATVNYTRTSYHTAWHPLFVPFAMSYDDWSDKGAVAELIGVGDDGVLEWTTIKSGSIEAGKPYIFKPNATGEVKFTASDVTLKDFTHITPLTYTMSEGAYTLSGTYTEKTDMAATHAYALSGGNFYYTTDESKTLKPYRIFLTVPSTTSALVRSRVDGDDVTAIEGLTIDSPSTDGLPFNLQGIRVDDNYKGIVIINGKMVLRR